jgi:hypothetical protein
MLLNSNPCVQSAVWYFAWRVILAHPGLPQAQSDWLKGILDLDSNQDNSHEVTNGATLLNQKRSAEAGDEPANLQAYCSGMGPHQTKFPDYGGSGIGAHPTIFPDYGGFQSKINDFFFAKFKVVVPP